MGFNGNPIFSEAEWRILEDRLALAPRQAQIVRYLFDGLNDKQIAVALEIAFSTVRSHLTRIYRKFNVQDRVELVLYIFGHFKPTVVKSESNEIDALDFLLVYGSNGSGLRRN